jgi:hypothetical protein
MKSIPAIFGYLLVFGAVVGAVWLVYPPVHPRQGNPPASTSERVPLSSDTALRHSVSHSLQH